MFISKIPCEHCKSVAFEIIDKWSEIWKSANSEGQWPIKTKKEKDIFFKQVESASGCYVFSKDQKSNNTLYIGKTSNLKKRMREHKDKIYFNRAKFVTVFKLANPEIYEYELQSQYNPKFGTRTSVVEDHARCLKCGKIRAL